jgi:hypothetical protein
MKTKERKTMPTVTRLNLSAVPRALAVDLKIGAARRGMRLTAYVCSLLAEAIEREKHAARAEQPQSGR